jgi:hypothetical protein
MPTTDQTAESRHVHVWLRDLEARGLASGTISEYKGYVALFRREVGPLLYADTFALSGFLLEHSDPHHRQERPKPGRVRHTG